MASPFTRLEEELTCPVCCNVFKDPVVLTCSHIFCRGCLQEWWTERPAQECPVCKKRTKKSSAKHPPPTNLVLKNLCEKYLEEKRQSAAAAAATSEELDLCAAHREKLRLFCRDDERLACLVCRDSDRHAGHKFSPVDEASGRLRETARESLKPLREKLEVCRRAKAICDRTGDHIPLQAQSVETRIKAQFEEFRQFLKDEERARISALRREKAAKSRTVAERGAELDGEAASLSDAIGAVEDQLRAEDHVSFLQNYRTMMERVQLTLQPYAEPQVVSGSLIDEARHLGNLAFSVWDKMKEMVSFSPVTLDPNTDDPEFVLSDDVTGVRLDVLNTGQRLPNNPERFDRSDVVRTLEEEQSLRRRAELESAQCNLQLQSSSQFPQRAGEASRSTQGAQYKLNKAVLKCKTGGFRVLAYCEPLTCLLASQKSPSGPGCGVKKISVVNTGAIQYVPIHAKQIRGLALQRQTESLMLSASLDNTVKLTSLMSNMVVHTYDTGMPVLSCCWSLDNSNYLYAGLLSGDVLVYDIRHSSTHVHQLQGPRSRYPGASLCYVPRAASGSFPCGGLIVGTLEGAYFWEQVDGTTYKPHSLPLETSSCTDIQVDTESRHCLVTYWPGRSNPVLRSVLMELSRTPQRDAVAQEPGCCSWKPLRTFSAGSYSTPYCRLLTKNAVFGSPTGQGATLVCVGDEASNSTMVWDAGSGALLQKLPAGQPVLDISPFVVNGDHYLASLTEKTVKIYKWE